MRAPGLRVISVIALLVLAACGANTQSSSSATEGNSSASAASSATPSEESAAPSESAEALAPVRIAITSLFPTHTALYAAQELGLFAEHGVDVELVPTPNTQATFTAVVGGDADGLLTVPNSLISANAAPGDSGTRMKAVLSTLNLTLINLVAKPDITSVEDLAGKRGGSTQANDIRFHLTTRYLNEHGVDASSIQWNTAGGNPAGLLTALIADQIDFTVLPAPQLFEAEDRGYTTLITGEDWGQYPSLMLTFTTPFLEEHRNSVEAVVAAYAEAIQMLQEDRDLGIEMLMGQMETEDETLANRTYDYLVPNLVADCIPSDGLELARQDVASTSPEAADLDVASIVDESFVKDLASADGPVTDNECSG